jgi:transposase-like protein
MEQLKADLQKAAAAYVLAVAADVQDQEPIQCSQLVPVLETIAEAIDLEQIANTWLKGTGDCPHCGSHNGETTEIRHYPNSPTEGTYFCRNCGEKHDW